MPGLPQPFSCNSYESYFRRLDYRRLVIFGHVFGYILKREAPLIEIPETSRRTRGAADKRDPIDILAVGPPSIHAHPSRPHDKTRG